MGGGDRHWNDDTQRWETGPPPPAPNRAPAPFPAPAPDPADLADPARPADAPTAVTSAPSAAPDPFAASGTSGASDTSPQWHEETGGWLLPEGSAGPVRRPGGGVDRRLVWSVVVGAAVVGVAVSLVLTFVGGDGEGGDEGKASARSASAPSTDRASEAPPPEGSSGVPSPLSPSPSVSGPPAGFTVRDDKEGFRIAVPEEWTRSSVPSQYGIAVVSYRSPDRAHRLQVFQVAESSPEESFRLFLSDGTPRPAGFRKVSLRKVDDGGTAGFRLEYLASRLRGEPDLGTWHVDDERFVGVDGQVWAIASYGPDADGGADELRYLTVALESFCPPGAGCLTVSVPG
ncbi:hypothetical protein [Streptomyces griseoviridis]|uniref:hypothetical protein n=1 Tax=Streptomyces griseoviridis TaxID=45398 RepID=UPI0034520292